MDKELKILQQENIKLKEKISELTKELENSKKELEKSHIKDNELSFINEVLTQTKEIGDKYRSKLGSRDFFNLMTRINKENFSFGEQLNFIKKFHHVTRGVYSPVPYSLDEFLLEECAYLKKIITNPLSEKEDVKNALTIFETCVKVLALRYEEREFPMNIAKHVDELELYKRIALILNK